MSPRRLIPYLLIFLVLAGTYAGLKWRQEQQTTREEQAKKVFHLTEPEISDLSLIRGKDEVRLAKKDKVWYLTAPLSAKADQTIVDNMLTTLARLRKERDLGVEKDFKPYGLDKPGLVVKFTAQGKPHQLAVGAKVPGDRNYYVRADQDPHLLMISQGSKDSLDRQLLALRDKSLLAFITGEVKGLKVVTGKTIINLEKTGPQTWRWVGRPDFKVRGDKVEKLLRDLQLAQAKNFLEPPPKNLRASRPGSPFDDRDHRGHTGGKSDSLVEPQTRRGGLRPQRSRRPHRAGGGEPARGYCQVPGFSGRPPLVVRSHLSSLPDHLGPTRQDLDGQERPRILAPHRTGPDGYEPALCAPGDGPVEFSETGSSKNPAQAWRRRCPGL